MSDFKKVHSLGSELLWGGGWADGRTDMTKLIAALRNFANASKKTSYFYSVLRIMAIFPLAVFIGCL